MVYEKIDMQISKITVIGGGSWGTALAALLAGKKYPASVLVRDSELARSINELHENSRYLPGLKLPEGLFATTSEAEALDQTDLIVWAIPCQSSREAMRKLRPHFPRNSVVVSATKGIEVANLRRVEEMVEEELGGLGVNYAVISGPSFAKEVVQDKPTAVVLACRNKQICKPLQSVFSTRHFRAYASLDVVGVEMGGAVKNVIAIAAGLIDGLGLGYNAMAALITRGLAEICRLGLAMGADKQTFMGLSGVGDLVLTCTGELSRNRNVGYQLGKGKDLATITHEMRMVAEGVKTAVAVQNLAREKNVDMPITAAVCQVLAGSVKPEEAVHLLMTRALKME